MSPTYTYVTLATVEQQISNRLYDSTQQFWPPAELLLYIQEALLTWNALTSYWRGDFIFPSIPITFWYDLTLQPNSLCPLTITDAQLYKEIQYHLLEPAVGVNPWTGVSTQFTADDLIHAVERRRNELLSITNCTQTRRLIPAVPGRITLPDTVLDIRRMAYLPISNGIPYGTGLYGVGPYGAGLPYLGSVVWPEDAWGEQSFNRNYTLAPAGTPLSYLQTTQPPISFDTDCPPAFGGSYELLTSEAGPALSATTPQTLSVPDNWAHVIKWGALADLLSKESNAKDAARAEYCNMRHQMGIALLAKAPQLLQLRLGNVPLQIDSARAADFYQTSWQSQPAATPTEALHSGMNLIALNPVPSVAQSLTATVVQTAPLPVLPGDFVQVGRDDLDVIIDYAQHLAAFKMGGAEFQATIPLFKRFMRQASTYGLKLAEIAEYTSVIYAQSAREKEMNPLLAPAPIEAD
jgi:hypothetical protein